MMTEASELLFSYGTLQQEAVQRATFRRKLDGVPDVLVGYKRSMLEITDPEVIAMSGKTHHPIVAYSGVETDRIPGTVFAITPAELAAADAYEVDAYVRVRTVLASGRVAWVYVFRCT
jgi:gamma-glutamylcyclotransferase (GGCT)/AIG2-like uncharacterized protein YtfP